MAMIGGASTVAFAAGVEVATLLQSDGLPEPLRLVVLTTIGVFLAIIGGFTLLKRFRLAPARPPHGDFGSQLAEALTTQAGWRGEVTANLAAIMQSCSALPALLQTISAVTGDTKVQIAQLQEARNAILLDNSKTRHDFLVPMKQVIDGAYKEIDETLVPHLTDVRDYVIRQEGKT